MDYDTLPLIEFFFSRIYNSDVYRLRKERRKGACLPWNKALISMDMDQD